MTLRFPVSNDPVSILPPPPPDLTIAEFEAQRAEARWQAAKLNVLRPEPLVMPVLRWQAFKDMLWISTFVVAGCAFAFFLLMALLGGAQ